MALKSLLVVCIVIMRCEVCTCHIGFIKLACNHISHASAIAITAVCVAFKSHMIFSLQNACGPLQLAVGFVCISAYLMFCIHLSMAGVHVFTCLGQLQICRTSLGGRIPTTWKSARHDNLCIGFLLSSITLFLLAKCHS